MQARDREETRVEARTQDKASKGRWPWLELSVLAGYFVLTILLTWPLALNFGSSVPAGPSEDRYQNFWNFWWVGQALSQVKNPFETDALFYPYYTGGANPTLPLYLHTLQLLNCVLTLPLSATSGPAAAYNALIFFSFSLSGLGAFLLGRRLTGNFGAGLLAGLVFSFSVSHFSSVQQSITNIMSIQWLPFYAWALLGWQERRSWKWAALAGFFLALVVYTDWYNTIYLLFYSAFFYLVTAFPKGWWKQLPGVVIALAVGGLLGSFAIVGAFLTLKSPLYAAQFDVNRDLRASKTLPEVINPQTAQGLLFWLGLLVGIGLIVSGGKWRKMGGYWLAFFLLSSLFTLGPKLQLSQPQGEPNPTGIPLPYALIKLIPGASVMRAPDRFDIPAQLGLAVILAAGLARFSGWLETRVRRDNPGFLSRGLVNNGLLVVVALIYLWQVNVAPLGLVPVQPASFVSVLPKDGDYQILELPITRHYNFDHERMLNQIYHQRPIMGGYLARPVSDPYRTPDSPFRYLAEQSYIYGSDPNKEIFGAQHVLAQLDNVLKLYNFRYIVLYKDDYKFEKERQGTKDLIERQLGPGNIIFEDSHAAVYKVPESFWQRPNLTPALFTGEGWYGVEQNPQGLYRWMNQQADLYVTTAQPGKIKLSLTAQAFGGDRTMRISANGQKLYEGLITPAPQTIEVEFAVKAGTTGLRLESLSPAQTAQELGLGQDKRQLAFLVKNVDIKAEFANK